MSQQQQHHPGTARHSALGGMELPRQRAGSREVPTRDAAESEAGTQTGGSALVAPSLTPTLDEFRLIPRPQLISRAQPHWVIAFRANARARGIASDVAAVILAMLDVWLVIPEDAPGYSLPLSGAAVAAMVMRRQLPFLAVLVTVPGFLTGWSQLAAMIALGTLAKPPRLGLAAGGRLDPGLPLRLHPLAAVRLRRPDVARARARRDLGGHRGRACRWRSGC